MLQLKNRTPFAAQLLLLPDADGVDTLYGVIKGTFSLGPRVTVAEQQAPVRLADEYYGEPHSSSIRSTSDVCLGKPGTDVVLIGSAWAPEGRPIWHMDVSLTVGPLSKTVRVFGDRVWEGSSAGATIAWIAPFVRMPLVWERAYGGSDQNDKGPSAAPRNPVGTGYRVSGGIRPIAGMPLANVEDPRALISGPGDSPVPAGFAPIAPHWEPRKNFGGTYDAAWQGSRAPYLPSDFDARFFHFAPDGLASAQPLDGGALVDIRGATPEGVLRFQLPDVRVRVDYRVDKAVETRPAALETISIEPDAQRLVLVWRAALRCDKQALKIREVAISTSPSA